MKKILFVTNHLQYSDGVSNVLVNLANALAENKFEVTVMPIYKCDKDYIKQINNNVKIKPIFNGYFQGLTKIVKLFSQRYLYKKWIKEKYDIEIAFQAGEPTILLANSQNESAKHIAWMHGYDEVNIKYHEKFDKIICCAKSTSEEFKKVFKYPNKVSFLYNLVEDDAISRKANESLNINKKYDFTFCAVGRLSPEKGFDRLIKCHYKLLEEGYKYNLWIIGDGPERESIEQLIESKKLSKNEILLGFDKNPIKYIENSNMLICPSYSEGMSTVCTEALLIGKSVLTTNVNGAEELIKDYNCGIMVDNNDEALYEGMKFILENESKLIEYENNIKRNGNLRYKDRLVSIINFFSEE